LFLSLEEDIAGCVGLLEFFLELIIVHLLHGLILDGHFVGGGLQTRLDGDLPVFQVRLDGYVFIVDFMLNRLVFVLHCGLDGHVLVL
jgi:hypothetical protein